MKHLRSDKKHCEPVIDEYGFRGHVWFRFVVKVVI